MDTKEIQTMPERVNMDKFRAILQKRALVARFKVEHFTEDLPAMLLECYIDEVAQRSGTFQGDKATIQHIDKAAKWLTGEYKSGLMLSGIVGNGKATLARAIARLIGLVYGDNQQNYKDRRTVKTVSALELADIAKQDPDMFRTIKNTQLLAIDDVGVEPALVKNWGNEISPFVETIYHRYDRQLFTIMTSNLNPEDLEKRYGARIADRFTEMFDRIAFENNTYRK